MNSLLVSAAAQECALMRANENGPNGGGGELIRKLHKAYQLTGMFYNIRFAYFMSALSTL
jgi:hypothetical protein